jgi:hypothetical protein
VTRKNAMATLAAPPENEPPSGVARVGRQVVLSALALLCLVGIAVVLRRPSYALSQPFWLDEAWVANVIRGPWRQLPMLASSTPIGWSCLLRLAPRFDGPQQLRLVPLSLAAFTIFPVYFLGRLVWPERRWPAILLGAIIAALPASVAYLELKPYTTEACLALGLVTLGIWVQRAAAIRTRLIIFTLVAIASFLLSHTAFIVVIAVLLALFVQAALNCDGSTLAAITGAGLAVAGVEAALYLLFISQADNSNMRAYWRFDYIPVRGSVTYAVDFAATRLARSLAATGFGPWPLCLALIAIGAVTLFQRRAAPAPVAIAVITVVLVVAGALGRYPFLGPRTSMFYTAMLALLAGAGLVRLVGVATHGLAPAPARLTHWLLRSLAGTVAGIAIVLFIQATLQARTQLISAEDVPQKIACIIKHRQPGDAILVSWASSYAFAYYWPATPIFVPKTAPIAVLYQVTYPEPSDVIIAGFGDKLSIRAAITAAAARGGRVWVILSPIDQSQFDLRALCVCSTSFAGTPPLFLLTPKKDETGRGR